MTKGICLNRYQIIMCKNMTKYDYKIDSILNIT